MPTASVDLAVGGKGLDEAVRQIAGSAPWAFETIALRSLMPPDDGAATGSLREVPR